jgi:hypothetical protein
MANALLVHEVNSSDNFFKENSRIVFSHLANILANFEKQATGSILKHQEYQVLFLRARGLCYSSVIAIVLN